MFCFVLRIIWVIGGAGKREWPAFKAWFARSLQPALNAWMGDVDVVYDGASPLDPSNKYVFGYAPHGLFPIGGSCQSNSSLKKRKLELLICCMTRACFLLIASKSLLEVLCFCVGEQ